MVRVTAKTQTTRKAKIILLDIFLSISIYLRVSERINWMILNCNRSVYLYQKYKANNFKNF